MAKTTVDIDQTLLAAAKSRLGTSTIKETVNAALREIAERGEREEAIDEIASMVRNGDLDWGVLDGKEDCRPSFASEVKEVSGACLGERVRRMAMEPWGTGHEAGTGHPAGEPDGPAAPSWDAAVGTRSAVSCASMDARPGAWSASMQPGYGALEDSEDSREKAATAPRDNELDGSAVTPNETRGGAG